MNKFHWNENCLPTDFEELIDIIRRDELNVHNEENIFEACMRWIKWDDTRIPMLPQVLSKVRLPLLTPQFLADRVATEDLVRSNHKCRDLIDEAKDFHLMPERRALVQSFRTRPRCYDAWIGQIFAVGGLTKNGDSVSTVEIYDPITKEWHGWSNVHASFAGWSCRFKWKIICIWRIQWNRTTVNGTNFTSDTCD